MFLDRECHPKHPAMMNIVRMTSEIRIITWNFYQAIYIGQLRRLFLDWFKSKFVIDEEQLDIFSLPFDISLNQATFKFYP